MSVPHNYYLDAVNALILGQRIEINQAADPDFNIGSLRVTLLRELRKIPEDSGMANLRHLRTAVQPNGNIQLWLVSGDAKLCYTIVSEDNNSQPQES